MEKKNPVGPPTKYHDKIPSELIEYFENYDTFTLMGKEFPKVKTIEGFCAQQKIAKSTFHEWRKKYSELSNAWEIAKNLQADMLFNFSSNRIIDPNYGRLLTVNCTDMKDKIETTHDVSDNVLQLNYKLKE